MTNYTRYLYFIFCITISIRVAMWLGIDIVGVILFIIIIQPIYLLDGR